MYPFVEVFGMKIFMTGLGIVIAFLTFIFSAYGLCKKNHQDFMKLFHWLPLLIVLVYFFGLYVSFVLTTGNFLPHSLKDIWLLISPYGYKFHYVGVLIGAFLAFWRFFSTIKRNENKKVWIDIFFTSLCNGLIVFGIFLVLGDDMIGLPTDSLLAIKAFHPESELTKFDGVYPVGLFLSAGALLVNIVITFRKIFSKKTGLGLFGFIGLFGVMSITFLFQNYPKYGVIPLSSSLSFDVKQYLSFFMMIVCLILYFKWNRKKTF